MKNYDNVSSALKATFDKKIALLGGAGPWASAYAHTTLIHLSQWDYGAVEDADYPEILHISIPLKGFGAKGIEDPDLVRMQLRDTFNLFSQWGADLAVMACNSLHTFYDDISTMSDITIVHLPRTGAEVVAQRGYKKVGVFCSESALKDNLHKDALQAHGIEAILPERDQQNRINTLIKLIMGGDNTSALYQDFRKLTREFEAKGAQVILSGCTELSWLATKAQPDMPIIDCLNVALTKTLKLAARQP